MTAHSVDSGRLRVAIAWAMATALSGATAQGVQVLSGVNFQQLDVRTAAFGQFGRVVADRSVLGGSGFVNVADSSGEWLVRNLPILDAATMDSNMMTTKYDLKTADGSPAGSRSYYVDYSSSPSDDLSDFLPGLPTYLPYTVSPSIYAAGGVPAGATWSGADTLDSYLDGPTNADLNTNLGFNLAGLNQAKFQKNHPNEQAANDQCAPMAVANSLQFLENTTDINIPHNHAPGLKGDNTLVGKLDTAMDRGVRTRADGDGVWPLDGKLKYISETGNLKNNTVVKHYSGDNLLGLNGYTGGATNVLLDGDNDLTRHGVTSTGKGKVSWQAIFDELNDGEDVEIDLVYVDILGNVLGRHYVEVVGAGTVLGVPYIQHVSDHLQTDSDPLDNMGTGVVDFEWMIGTFALNSFAYIDQMIVQSPVPEPATAVLAAIGVAAGLSRMRRKRAGR